VIIFVAVSWLALFALYLGCAPGAFYFEDSAELLACAATLGNTHPPGYPALVLPGRLLLLVPVGGPSFRWNVTLAAAAAAAAVALGALTYRLVRRFGSNGVAIAAAVFAAGTWSLSDAFWWEAVIGDKYGAWYLAFVLVVLLAIDALDALPPVFGSVFARLSLATGIALAFHQYSVFALPAVAVALVRPAAIRAFGLRVPLLRIVVVGACFLALPLSLKVLYPPMRSGRTALDWGAPRTAGRLAGYLGGKLYRGVFASTSIPVNPPVLGHRVGKALRLLIEEVPWPLLVGAPIGLYAVARASGVAALGLSVCALADVLWAINFSEKIVRWYEPAYAVLLLFSAAGFAWLAGLTGRRAGRWMAVIALVAVVLQCRRGLARNDLSRFYAAHDLGRNLAMSLPPRAVYLGAGDFDLFPLWGLKWTEGERPDITAFGMGNFVDSGLAGAGGQEELMRSLGIPAKKAARSPGDGRQATADRDTKAAGLPGGLGSGPEMLKALLDSEYPVMVASAGYDRQLHAVMPFLKVIRYRGIAGRLIRGWDVPGSAADTARAVRAYTFRGLLYARSGTVSDLVRLRDEVARGALLHYPACFASFGSLALRFGLTRDAARAFTLAGRQMEALAPRSPRDGVPPSAEYYRGLGMPAPLAAAEAGRAAVVMGYHRLADVFEEREVAFLAGQLRGNAVALAQR
jgi:hypothetical protein